jgi:hypothetical protein
MFHGQSRTINPGIAIATIVAIILTVAIVFWRASAPAIPTPRAGQTLENPFGMQNVPPTAAMRR